MNLLDKLLLALRSTVNDVVSEDVAPAPKEEQVLREIDRAQARLDTLRDDLARAEKRGQEELAERLKKEIADLQKTLDKTRKRLNQVKGREATSTPAEGVDETKTAQAKDVEPAQKALDKHEGIVTKHEDQAAAPAPDELDSTRIADALNKQKKAE
jgi:phage shock protein A